MRVLAQLASTALLAAGRSDRREMEALLRDAGFDPVSIDVENPIADFDEPASLCLVDLRENGNAVRIARAIRTRHPQTVVIGVSDPSRPAAAADALRAGVFDILPRPPSARDLEALLANAREQARLAATASQGSQHSDVSPHGIVANSVAMRATMELVHRAAAARCGIALCGERGTGREMIAKLIHANGAGPDSPFIKVDCSRSSTEDAEFELFGAVTKRGGQGPDRQNLERLGGASRILEAAGGVLFLKNVAELSPRSQARLARLLRDRSALVDGSNNQVQLDIRPIATFDGSTGNADERGLRPELHERLTLIRIDLPSLKQRREDISVLATHFLKELCQLNGRPLKTLTRPAQTLLSALPWPGNVPELRALLERLLLLVPGGLIRLEDVLAHTRIESSVSPIGIDATLRSARARFERDYIAAVLQHHHGRIADAAKVLGVQRTNLYRKMRRLNLARTNGAV